MSGVLSHAATASAVGPAGAGRAFSPASNAALAASAAPNSSDARVAKPRYITSRRARLSAYCMTGT